jgi:hypothetical protein
MSNQSIERDLKKGGAELLILSILAACQRHGYEINTLIETRSKGAVRFRGGRELGRDEQTPVTLHIAALPGYLEPMGITLLGGRGFTERDSLPGSPRVAIVNASFAPCRRCESSYSPTAAA